MAFGAGTKPAYSVPKPKKVQTAHSVSRPSALKPKASTTRPRASSTCCGHKA